MAALETYLRAAKDTKGVDHMRQIRIARTYVAMQTEARMKEAVQRINDPRLLKILLEVGVKDSIQREILNQVDRIRGKKGID